MKHRRLLNKIIGQAPWSVWKGIGSFLLFEFGPRKCTLKSGRPQGTYTLWILMAHWRIRKKGKEIAHSESTDTTINRAAKLLEGNQLRAIVLEEIIDENTVRHAACFHFDGGFMLQALMYENHKPDSIFMLYYPKHVLFFNYDGNLVTQKKQRLSESHSFNPNGEGYFRIGDFHSRANAEEVARR